MFTRKKIETKIVLQSNCAHTTRKRKKEKKAKLAILYKGADFYLKTNVAKKHVCSCRTEKKKGKNGKSNIAILVHSNNFHGAFIVRFKLGGQ